MKNFTLTFLMALVVPFSLMANEVVKPLSIAVVDVQQLMNESKAAKSIQSQGKDLRKKYQSKISKIEDSLKSAEKKVVDAGKEQNQEKFIESRKDFQKELIESQKKLRDYNKNLDEAIAKALNELKDEIIKIVDDMTVENNYDLVITRADVINVSKNIDITADIMNKLNKSLSSIKVKD